MTSDSGNNTPPDSEETIPVPGPGESSTASSDNYPGQIGPYKILEVLGEGGMGVVYLAEQKEPVRRRVALKVIKLGMDTKEVVARFEAERQALAQMNHPNIARVHDAGATDDGRPYFAMEAIEGVPITDYCDRHKLSIKDRLNLFLQVCQGVSHAHHRGIIHRDIKPTNILVSVPDDKAVAKIIDFGVARATNQRLTEKTLYTELGKAVGTPAYMSPEQAEMTGERVDHRTDIYSLGALLYELLIGQMPLDLDVHLIAFDEIVRRIREEEPYTPSTRWTRLNIERTKELANHRRVNPAMLASEIRGDLDWITMKAMEKERNRRYSTAAELAADISRHLNNEPVMASPPSVVYRLQKFFRKHRGPVTAVAAVVVVLILGLAISMSSYFRANEALNEKSQALIEKGQALEEVLRLSDIKRLNDYVAEAEDLWPAVPGKIPAMKEWLKKAEELVRHRPDHLKTLTALREKALPYDASMRDYDRKAHPQAAEVSKQRTWRFPNPELEWQHDTLSELVAGLETFTDPDPFKGALSSVKERLEFASTIHKKSIEDYKEAWEKAVSSIADPGHCPMYEGLRIKPQLGLVPIGRDPHSKLWEFAHLQTGEIPERGEDGKLLLSEEMALVFVLLPGGSFMMGAVRPSLGVRTEKGSVELRVQEIVEGSLAERLQIEPGDLVQAVNGVEVKSAEDLAKVFGPLRSSAAVTVELERGGERKNFSGNLGPNIDLEAHGNEGPVQEVTLAPFFISKYEMTQGQWLRFTEENPSLYGPERKFLGKQHSLLHPVEQVSWEDCDRVLKRLDLVLPTEAQWEYACRAGTRSVWWTGDERESLEGSVNIADQAAARAGVSWGDIKDWPELDDGYVVHAPVGVYAANPFGLHEVHGNVYEWCRDWFGDYKLPGNLNDGERQVPIGARYRVSRGGSFGHAARYSRSADRYYYTPGVRDRGLGLRPAMGVITE